jgi:hypothetical protein
MKAVRIGRVRENARETHSRADACPIFSPCAKRKQEAKWIGAVKIVRFEPNFLSPFYLE